MVLCTYVISPVARPGPTLPYQAVQLCYSSKQETEMINTEHLYEYSVLQYLGYYPEYRSFRIINSNN